MSYKGYVYQPYPKWVVGSDGVRKIVNNPAQHTQATGIEVDEHGEEIYRPKLPTIEEVLAAGYAQNAAERIVAKENRKLELKEKPYGPNEPTEFPEPPPVEPPVIDPPAVAEVVLPEAEPQAEAETPIRLGRRKRQAEPEQAQLPTEEPIAEV